MNEIWDTEKHGRGRFDADNTLRRRKRHGEPRTVLTNEVMNVCILKHDSHLERR
jgi:hypothetical protein